MSELRFLLSFSVDSSGFGAYHKVTARPVHYDDDGKITNILDSWGEDARELAGFMVTAQADESSIEFYGYQPCYSDFYRVTQESAELMVKTFRKINRVLERFDKSFGYAGDFSTYLIRVANALGIKSFGHKVRDSKNWTYDASDYRWLDVQGVSGLIRQETERFAAEHGKRGTVS